MTLFAIAAIWQPAISSAASPTTVTIAPNTPSTGNCIPFGNVSGAAWTPFAAFVYRNIPAFELKPNDTLAFDTTLTQNDADINLDIALARTTINGNDTNAQPFTTVVNNTETATNPRGDTTTGNFDLAFTAQAPFSFPGGGLIIRFSNPSAAYALDSTCTGNLFAANNATDTSNFFVERALTDPNGISPWDTHDASDIGAFRLTLLPTSNVFTFGNVKRKTHKGTATLAVNVPGPGTLSLTGTGVKPQRSGEATTSMIITTAGTVNLLIKAKGAKKHKLNKKGKVKVKVNVTYAPSGSPAGDPNTQTDRIKLVKKK